MEDQYRISPRAKFLNYEEGCYFVTVCTKNRLPYFGEIDEDKMCLSLIGAFLNEQIMNVSAFCGGMVQIPCHVVMPNHFHILAIVSRHRFLEKDLFDAQSSFSYRTPNPMLRPHETTARRVPALSRYVNSLKGAVSKFAKEHALEFGWQPRFHDHMVRDTNEYKSIANYINCNVINWAKDCFNSGK